MKTSNKKVEANRKPKRKKNQKNTIKNNRKIIQRQ